MGAIAMNYRRLGCLCGLVVWGWVLWCAPATAAKVNLVNGKQLTGELVEEDDLSIRLQVGGVTISLLKSEVVSLVDDQGRVRVMKGAEPGPPQPQELPAKAEPVSSAPLRTVEKVEPLLPIVRPEGQTHAVRADMLNIRQGPGADFEKIGAVTKDTVLIELGRQGQWLRVRLPNGSVGWVSDRYTRPLQDEPVVCTGQRVNFRQGAGLDYRIFRKLGEQEVLLLLRLQGDWAQLRDAEGTIGWASAQYVGRPADPSALTPDYKRLESDPEGGTMAEAVVEQSEPVIGSSAWTKRLALSDADWVSGGRIALVFLAQEAEPSAWETLVQGKDIVGKVSFVGERAAERLGLGPTLGGDAGAAQRVVLKGYLKGQSWVFEYRLAQPEPAGLQRLLVGQQGVRRGVVHAF